MISCKEYVEQKKQELSDTICSKDRVPNLVIVQVGDNPASNSYIKGKLKDCEEVGIKTRLIKLPETANQTELMEALLQPEADGIILQLPIPPHLDADLATKWCVNPVQDVDGFLPDSLYKPCTPKGIMDWLTYNQIDLTGKNVVIIGRSDIVGKPLTRMMTDANATVTLCHSKTPFTDIIQYCENADIVISAVGKPKWLNFDSKKKAIVIDVGINRDDNNKLCGDIGVVTNAAYITPVPGGVGLLTRVALLDNVIY